MKPTWRTRRTASLLLACALCSVAPVLAQYSKLVGVDGQTPFSAAFVRECRAAEEAALKTQSIEPLLRLLDKYKKREELAELELTLGLVLSQRTGLTNPAQAVVHLTSALKYELPEATRLQALNWRADNLSKLGRYDEALRDRLRVLLVASYRDLSGACQEVKGSTLPLNVRSQDPEDERRRKDYEEYRAQLQRQQDLLMSRYTAIEGANDLTRRLSMSNEKIRVVLNELSPDSSRYEVIARWMQSENPWPCRQEPVPRKSIEPSLEIPPAVGKVPADPAATLDAEVARFRQEILQHHNQMLDQFIVAGLLTTAEAATLQRPLVDLVVRNGGGK